MESYGVDPPELVCIFRKRWPDIISYRFHKKEEVDLAFVTLGNILDKITLFSQYRNYESQTTVIWKRSKSIQTL